MAKIGTLVAKEGIELNENELEFMQDIIKRGMVHVFGDHVTYDLEVKEGYNHGMYYDVKNIRVHNLPLCTMRMRHTNRKHQYCYGDCLQPTHIMLSLHHNRCYNEFETGKCYTWPEGFKPELKYTDYQMHITMYGAHRRYRSRNWSYGTGLVWDFQYGTELNDLNAWEALDDMRRLMGRGSCSMQVNDAA